MTIQRRNHGRYHSYVDTATGEKIPGVTKFTDEGIPKAALIDWAVRTTIEFAIDNWHDLSKASISERIKRLNGARWEAKDKAAGRGTQVHKLGERLVRGEKVAVPDGLEGYVQSYVRFLDEFDVRPLLVEAVVVSRRHRYCGTLDLIAELLDPDDPEPDPELRARVTWLLDLKTTRSGIFGETALQLSGYRYADAVVDADGNEFELPEIDRVGAVHIRPDGYSLVPVDAGELSHRRLLYAQQIRAFVEESRSLVGEPIDPPHTSTYRLERS